MSAERNLLWKAIREEVYLTLDSLDYTATAEEIDNITDDVINDESIRGEFNYGVLDIIQRHLGNK